MRWDRNISVYGEHLLYEPLKFYLSGILEWPCAAPLPKRAPSSDRKFLARTGRFGGSVAVRFCSVQDVGHAIPGGYDPFPQFCQIYELTTGHIVTDAQTISGWWQYELSGGSIRRSGYPWHHRLDYTGYNWSHCICGASRGMGRERLISGRYFRSLRARRPV